MNCPYCGKSDSRVLETRESGQESVTRRRRECTGCGERYTTYERVEVPSLAVRKRDGSEEPFQIEKLRAGIVNACKKRPVTEEEIDEIASSVESEIAGRGESVVESSTIGDLVIEELKERDKVAYIRFASIYRSFDDVDAFEEEVQTLKGS